MRYRLIYKDNKLRFTQLVKYCLVHGEEPQEDDRKEPLAIWDNSDDSYGIYRAVYFYQDFIVVQFGLFEQPYSLKLKIDSYTQHTVNGQTVDAITFKKYLAVFYLDSRPQARITKLPVVL